MTTIVSETTLVDMPGNWWPKSNSHSISLYDNYSYDYSTLYKAQPNVRVCVDFLARNIAQLGLHVYRRKENNDRERLRDHELALLLDRPLPEKFKVTQYRLLESLMGDLGVYHNAYILKLRQDGKITGLLRIPPAYMTVEGSLYPSKYTLNLITGQQVLDAEDVMHFWAYNAENAATGLSPLETLRRILAEEHAAGDYRENFWQNSARMSGLIERPATAPEWSNEARARFKEEFAELYTGGENSGKTAVLEEGMQWKQISFNPRESEYLTGRKLTREECARAFHIPPPLVGILDHATFSNITEQHKMLYTDVLGPWCESIEQDFQLQLLSDFDDRDGIYLEFNIQEKLQGDFESQTKSLQSAIGRAWMTPNEGRARMNLPWHEGGDELTVPLNVTLGGQASPNDVDPTKGSHLPIPQRKGHEGRKADEDQDEEEPVVVVRTHDPKLRSQFETKWQELLISTFERQKTTVLARLGAQKARVKSDDINAIWNYDRWNEELTKDFTTLSWETVKAWAEKVAAILDITVNYEVMKYYIENNARIAAEYLNDSTVDQLEEALNDEDPISAVEEIFLLAAGVRAIAFAVGRVTGLSNFGTYSASRQGGKTKKTWVVKSKNPRDSHKSMNGETVGIRERFSNGLRWPGDYRGGAEENANCQCELEYS
jgi:HK97 family phage portal protein